MKQLGWTAGLSSLVGALGGVPLGEIAGLIIVAVVVGLITVGLELVRASDQRSVAEVFWRRSSPPPADADPPGPSSSTDEDS